MTSGRVCTAIRWCALASMSLPIVAACSSGSSGGSDALSAEETLLFYLQENSEDERELYAVHPDDPANPLQVGEELGELDDVLSPLGAAVVTVVAGDYEADALNRTHLAWVVYAGDDGHLYRASTRLPEGPLDVPQPVRVSSEDAASMLCSMQVETDYADPLNSALIYELPGGIDNDDCGGGAASAYVVQLDAPDNEDPEPLSPASTIGSGYDMALRDPATGGLEEFVFLTGSHIEHFDLESRQWSTGHDFDDDMYSTTTRGVVYPGNASARMLLRESNGISNDYFVYEVRDRELQDVELAPEVDDFDLSSASRGVGTRERMLLVTNPAATSILNHLPFDDEEGYTIERLNQEEDTSSGRIYTLGEDHVVWRFEDSGTMGYVLESIALDTGESTELARGDDMAGNLNLSRVDSPQTPHGWVHFGDWSNSLSHEAVDIRGPGFGNQSLDVSRITGNSWAPRVRMTYGAAPWAPGVPLAGQKADRILIEKDDRVMSLDAGNPSGGLRDHGAMPENRRAWEALSYAPHVLILDRDDDVYFVDTRQAQSLVRVTDNNQQAALITGF